MLLHELFGLCLLCLLYVPSWVLRWGGVWACWLLFDNVVLVGLVVLGGAGRVCCCVWFQLGVCCVCLLLRNACCYVFNSVALCWCLRMWFVYCVVACLDVICLLLVASWLFGCSFEWRVS